VIVYKTRVRPEQVVKVVEAMDWGQPTGRHSESAVRVGRDG
jgi:hypothetical protein